MESRRNSRIRCPEGCCATSRSRCRCRLSPRTRPAVCPGTTGAVAIAYGRGSEGLRDVQGVVRQSTNGDSEGRRRHRVSTLCRLLQSQGQSAQQAMSTIDLLRRLGDRAEVERWNRILTAPKPAFNTSPNAFLVAMTAGVKPGRSLDVGMGQGRNTIYLAQQGWDSWDSIQPIGRWQPRRNGRRRLESGSRPQSRATWTLTGVNRSGT